MASNGAVVAVADQGAADQEKLTAQMSSLELVGEKQEQTEEQLPPHRSHNPDFNQKRSDPFQFGSRYLQEQDDVFEFNAWDHVETDDTYKEYAEQQYEMQRNSPVSDFDKCKFSPISSFSPHHGLESNPAPSDDLYHKHSSSDL